jgi:hypothetical protein
MTGGTISYMAFQMGVLWAAAEQFLIFDVVDEHLKLKIFRRDVTGLTAKS